MPDSKGRLTRPEMEAALANGQSLLIDGKIITKPSELPSVIDLAVGSGDRAEMTKTAEDIDAEIAYLQDQKQRLADQSAASSAADTADDGAADGAGDGAGDPSKKTPKSKDTPADVPPDDKTPPTA